MKMVSDHASTEPDANSVKVKVTAVGLNPLDVKVPFIPIYAKNRAASPVGVDFAGTIVALGSKVKDFKEGDVVYGIQMGGSLAEFINISAHAIAKIGKGFDVIEAAATPVAALTAMQGLRMVDALHSDKPLTIVILGASGGVGHLAVQLAKVCNPPGTKVVAVCSSKNATFVAGLGADTVLDYTKQGFDLSKAVNDADVVYDLIPYPEDTAMKCLKKGGKYVTAVPPMEPSTNPAFNVVFCESNTQDLTELAKLYEAKKIKTHISKTVKMAVQQELEDSMELLRSHRTVGKIVVTM